jgi:hypothetical protein
MNGLGLDMIQGYSSKPVFALTANSGTQDSPITSLTILAAKNQNSETKLRITSMATASVLYGKSAIKRELFHLCTCIAWT